MKQSLINNEMDCTFTYNLIKGKFYNLIIEYFHKQGEARMKLYWKSESIPKQIITEEYLFYFE